MAFAQFVFIAEDEKKVEPDWLCAAFGHPAMSLARLAFLTDLSRVLGGSTENALYSCIFGLSGECKYCVDKEAIGCSKRVDAFG
jgi:hypothetical protein